MILTENEIFKGKSCLIKDKQYFQAKDYINNFKDKVKDIATGFYYEAIAPDHLTKDDDQIDFFYSRVLVYASLNIKPQLEGFKQILGMIYTLDGKKPIYKIFRGYVEESTMNLHVFSPNWIIVSELEPAKDMYINIKQLMDLEDNFGENMKSLKNTEIKYGMLTTFLGSKIKGCLEKSYDNGFHTIKLSTKDVIDIYKNLFVDKNSRKFINQDKKVTFFDIYKEMIEIISDDEKDIINRFEKTLLWNNILNG